jgi:hypothetical protein
MTAAHADIIVHTGLRAGTGSEGMLRYLSDRVAMATGQQVSRMSTNAAELIHASELSSS